MEGAAGDPTPYPETGWATRTGSTRRPNRASSRFAGATGGAHRVAKRHHSPRARAETQMCHRSGDVQVIDVHHVVPGCDEVVDEFLTHVGTTVDFGKCGNCELEPNFGVDAPAGPIRFAGFAVVAVDEVSFF